MLVAFDGAAAREVVFRAPQWVSFHSAAALPSALAQRALGDALRDARPTSSLRGLLVVPEGDGPFPAVVLLHGCRGVLPSHRGWAQWLARQGFIALLVDSFLTRNAVNVCARHPEQGASQAVGGRVFDAFGALQYLQADPRVDPSRIALIGWQSWAALSAVARFGPRVLVRGAFRAAVAVSPRCPLSADESDSPVLIVIGEKDEWHSARACEQLVRHSASTVELLVLRNAGHGFDEVSAHAQPFVSRAFNAQLGRVAQVPSHYDGAAHERAAQGILHFLRRELGVDDERSASLAGVFRLPHAARWALDPAKPGPDHPPLGRSLFDRVFATGPAQGPAPNHGGYQVPFPFPRVLDTLERAIGAPPGTRQGLATALVPIGRSLQRRAAAPDFFRFPRLLVAVDGEPTHQPRAHFLKDRLFLGYHEKARVIEVISYNEQAARFEYQVVENYAPGHAPRVRYANRALCLSCHQNQAPIFSRAAWDETNANRHTARRLRAQRAQFYGVVTQADGALAARFDNATDRANLLSALQLLWREGCGGAAAGAPRCRAAALVAMVQYRLSAASGYETDDPFYRQHFAAMFERHWARLAPGGLAIPEADLLNRDPLLEPSPTEIDAHLDPLTARGPGAIWDREQAMKRLIVELSQSLPAADLAALDAQLGTPAQRAGAPRHEVVLPCTVASGRRSEQNALMQVRCGAAALDARTEVARDVSLYGATTWTASTEPELVMELNVAAGQVKDGFVSHIRMPAGDRFERIQVSAATIGVEENGWRRARLRLRQGNGWSVRDHRGHALQPVELRWAPHATSRSSGLREGSAQIRVVADFAAVRKAAQHLITDAEKSVVQARGSASFDSASDSGAGISEPGVLGNASFMPTQVLNALVRRLDPAARRWCCDATVLPELVLDVDARSAQSTSAPRADEAIVASFRHHCATCHAGPTQAPPGFLHGSEAQVMAQIRQCAPRIALRLGMWLRADNERSHSPMPPPTTLASRGLDATRWRNSIAFDRLLRWAQGQSEVATAPESDNAALPSSGVARCLAIASPVVRRADEESQR